MATTSDVEMLLAHKRTFIYLIDIVLIFNASPQLLR